MKPKAFFILCLVALAAGLVYLFATKWSGSAPEEAAIELRDEFTGKRAIDQGEAMKQQLREISENKQQLPY